MFRSRRLAGRRIMAITAVLSACVFQFGFLPSCKGVLTTLNPCGTILGFCEPEEIDLLFADVPDFSIDPTCTIPGFGFDPAAPGTPTGDCADQPVFPNTPGNRP